MTLPDSAYTQLTDDLRICRLLNGMWQVGGGHGRVDRAAAIRDMLAYHERGYTTWDLADHYGPAEDLIGQFRRQLAREHGVAEVDSHSQALTKWVPRPGPMTRQVVEDAMQVSWQRMNVDRIDLMQFHWWDYRDNRYLDALKHMADIRDSGKIRHLALTNFDTEHVRIITENGIKLASNQVQFSIIDRRPLAKMIPYCQQYGISLLTYGTFCGGLLSARYLDQPEPGQATLNTASLRKYKNMIDVWGGWDLFQALLRVLKTIAEKHSVSIANVAVRYILDQPAVAGVIVGARLGISQHRDDNARVFTFALDDQDLDAIHTITDQSQDLMRRIGDCGDEYRRQMR